MIRNVSYDRWFLGNLENVQRTMNNRREARELESAKQAGYNRRFDRVELSDEAEELLAAKRSEFQKQAEAEKIENSENEERKIASEKNVDKGETLTQQSYAKAAEVGEDDEDGFDLIKLINISTSELSATKGTAEVKSKMGLLDLIDSAIIKDPQPVARETPRLSPYDKATDVNNVRSSDPADKESESAGMQKTGQPLSAKDMRQQETERIREKAEEETVSSRRSGSKLTPAEEQGIETYERVQQYTDPYMVSMHVASNVA